MNFKLFARRGMRGRAELWHFPSNNFVGSSALCSVNSVRQHNQSMIRWIITFLVVALIAGVFGFTGVAGAATDIARILFYIFLVLLLVAIVASLFRGSPPAP